MDSAGKMDIIYNYNAITFQVTFTFNQYDLESRKRRYSLVAESNSGRRVLFLCFEHLEMHIATLIYMLLFQSDLDLSVSLSVDRTKIWARPFVEYPSRKQIYLVSCWTSGSWKQ
jgi:hypothetical protein